jgi:hypothetical protein
MVELSELINKENEAIYKTLVMMAHNPSIGRVFSADANKSVKLSIIRIIDRLPTIKSQKDFDREHKKIMDYIVNRIQNIRKDNPSGKISYGQAQKGLNVFLKIFIDWSNLPDKKTAIRIRPFLHCPLDSIVMKTIKNENEDLYNKHGKPKFNSLKEIDYEDYVKWQDIIKEIVGKNKRVLMDVIWYTRNPKQI